MFCLWGLYCSSRFIAWIYSGETHNSIILALPVRQSKNLFSGWVCIFIKDVVVGCVCFSLPPSFSAATVENLNSCLIEYNPTYDDWFNHAFLVLMRISRRLLVSISLRDECDSHESCHVGEVVLVSFCLCVCHRFFFFQESRWGTIIDPNLRWQN